MAQNYCETIVCSVIKSVSALQLLQDIMIHVSLSSCYGCLRKLVEICTYCFLFSSLSSPASPIFSQLPRAFWNIDAQILWKTIMYLHTYRFMHIDIYIYACIYVYIHTQTHRHVFIYIFPFQKATLRHYILLGIFCDHAYSKLFRLVTFSTGSRGQGRVCD